MRCLVAICTVAAVCGACGSVRGTSSPKTAAAVTPPSPTLASCARRGKADLAARQDVRQGSAVALAGSQGSLIAYVADADSHSIHTVAVDDGRELVRTQVGGAPRQLLLLADGRIVASLSDGTRIAVLEPKADPKAPLSLLCERDVAAEPWGLALSKGDQKLVVTSAWGAALTVFDTGTFAQEHVIALRRDPRSVVVDDDGVAFVSHLVGAKMSVIDLASTDPFPKVVDLSVHKSSGRSQVKDMLVYRSGAQGYAMAKVTVPNNGGTRILLPMVSVDPGEFERPQSVYYGPAFDGVPKEAPIVSVVDTVLKQPLNKYLVSATESKTVDQGSLRTIEEGRPFVRECLIPRAAAVREEGASLLVTCFGIDALLELDALAVDPFRAERRRFAMPPGPEGVAVDQASGRAVVFSQIAGSVTVIDLASKGAQAHTIDLDYRPDPALASAARGRQLFYRTDDARISNDGVACSSCHPDGRDDGNTWATPMGPRQTPMLAGRLVGTEPYGWEGDRKTLADYIGNTVIRLGGRGLAAEDLADISKFLLVAQAPPHLVGEAERARRGREIFLDDTQGCATCHSGAATTDAKTHDELGTGPHDSMSNFDTPSLRFVRGTAPYFHDGRYSSLESLLEDPKSKMGHTADLSDEDRVALATYLRVQ